MASAGAAGALAGLAVGTAAGASPKITRSSSPSAPADSIRNGILRLRSTTTRVTSGSRLFTATRTRETSAWLTPSAAGTPREAATPWKSSSTRGGMSAASCTVVAFSSPLPTSATVTSSPDRDARTARSSVAATRAVAAAAAGAMRTARAVIAARSTSTTMRLREVRTRCEVARSRLTLTRASGVPSAAVLCSTRTPRTGATVSGTWTPDAVTLRRSTSTVSGSGWLVT